MIQCAVQCSGNVVIRSCSGAAARLLPARWTERVPLQRSNRRMPSAQTRRRPQQYRPALSLLGFGTAWPIQRCVNFRYPKQARKTLTMAVSTTPPRSLSDNLSNSPPKTRSRSPPLPNKACTTACLPIAPSPSKAPSYRPAAEIMSCFPKSPVGTGALMLAGDARARVKVLATPVNREVMRSGTSKCI